MLNILFITYNTMLHKACTFDGNVFYCTIFPLFNGKETTTDKPKYFCVFCCLKVEE